jgi:hypothetical protein
MPTELSALLRDIPNLDDRLVRYLQQLESSLNFLLQTADQQKGAIDTNSRQIPSYLQIQQNLQASGITPLNVEALRGKLGESQVANAPSLSTLPALSDITYDDGTLISVSNIVYRRNRTTEPGSWDAISSSGSVTSFSAAPASIFDVATPTSTPALSLDNQAANIVLAGPGSGAAATPSFRALVTNDLPSDALHSTMTKTIAGAPYANDGYVEVVDKAGTIRRVMTTA